MKAVLKSSIGTDCMVTVLLDGRHVKATGVAYVEVEPEKRACIGFYNRNQYGDGTLVPPNSRILSASMKIVWGGTENKFPVVAVASRFQPSCPEADLLFEGMELENEIGEFSPTEKHGVHTLVLNEAGLKHLESSANKEFLHLSIGFVGGPACMPGESYSVLSDVVLEVEYEVESETETSDAETALEQPPVQNEVDEFDAEVDSLEEDAPVDESSDDFEDEEEDEDEDVSDEEDESEEDPERN